VKNKLLLSGCLAVMALTGAACAGKTPAHGCSNGWYITGYFTPLEQDYPAEPSVAIRTSDGQRLRLPQAFIRTVRTEGWGRLANGLYIGHYHNSWHLNRQALDSQGQALRIGTVATDTGVIPHGSVVQIPALNRSYLANDIGNGIEGQHIDVFCGEGRQAERLTYQVTLTDAEVCVNH
jgi:3D (Asp-Asp-Asp) domain-containing protein